LEQLVAWPFSLRCLHPSLGQDFQYGHEDPYEPFLTADAEEGAVAADMGVVAFHVSGKLVGVVVAIGNEGGHMDLLGNRPCHQKPYDHRPLDSCRACQACLQVRPCHPYRSCCSCPYHPCHPIHRVLVWVVHVPGVQPYFALRLQDDWLPEDQAPFHLAVSRAYLLNGNPVRSSLAACLRPCIVEVGDENHSGHLQGIWHVRASCWTCQGEQVAGMVTGWC